MINVTHDSSIVERNNSRHIPAAKYGFNSRSEYIRAVLRDALKHPEFNRADLKAMLAGEVEIQEGRTHKSENVKLESGRESTADE